MLKENTASKELEAIKDALQKYPNGASFEDIEKQSGLMLPRRTFQRRLLMLQNAGGLHIEGKTRATRYFSVVKTEQKAAATSKKMTSVFSSKLNPSWAFCITVSRLSFVWRAFRNPD